MASRRQYKRPPIHEAVCQVQFNGIGGWDFSTPGAIYDDLRGDYPALPIQQLSAPVITRTDETGTATIQPPTQLVKFTNEDESRTVMAGPTMLSVHVGGPYPGWDDFRARIIAAYSSYVSAAEPTDVVRIGVRYINRIEVPANSLELTTLFTYPPEVPESLGLNLSNFLLRIEAAQSDPAVRVIETFASAPAEPGTVAFLLDLDVVREWSPDDPLARSEAVTLIEDLRDLERDVFESLITDRAREMFDAS